MPRPKAAKNVKISPWLSARADCREGRFIQPGNSLFLSKKYQALKHGAQQLYLCMCIESGGRREFTFPHGSGRKYGFSDTTFDRYIKELRDNGFIELVADEGMAQFAPNVYRFIFDWKSP